MLVYNSRCSNTSSYHFIVSESVIRKNFIVYEHVLPHGNWKGNRNGRRALGQDITLKGEDIETDSI